MEESVTLELFYTTLISARNSVGINKAVKMLDRLPDNSRLAAEKYLVKYIMAPNNPVRLRLYVFDKGIANRSRSVGASRILMDYVKQVSSGKIVEPFLLVPYTVGMFYRLPVPQNWLMR